MDTTAKMQVVTEMKNGLKQWVNGIGTYAPVMLTYNFGDAIEYIINSVPDCNSQKLTDELITRVATTLAQDILSSLDKKSNNFSVGYNKFMQTWFNDTRNFNAACKHCPEFQAFYNKLPEKNRKRINAGRSMGSSGSNLLKCSIIVATFGLGYLLYLPSDLSLKKKVKSDAFQQLMIILNKSSIL